MLRIFIVLALAVLLLPARPPSKPAAIRPAELLVRSHPVPLSSGDPALRRVGALTYLGGWSLESDNPGFGGISSMLVSDRGQVFGLSDSGILVGVYMGAGEA